MALQADEGPEYEEHVFFVPQKALLVVKMKLKNDEEVSDELLQAFSYPGHLEDNEMLVPIDCAILDEHFPSEVSSIDEDGQLNVDHLIQKLGHKETGQLLVQAQQAFLANPHGIDPALRATPMTVSQWRSEGFYIEGMEEEMAEYDEEVNLEEANPEADNAPDQQPDGADESEEPSSKKARTA
ncbi:unnamed protein product [Durusdinium trenchii]|uniref:Chloroplastic n=2 Tax=Durusdinium trenchii TaxID=1381693 RepID=A0ABP0RL65_9DINO